MEQAHTLTEICRAMAEPAFYPHRVSRLERRDTHISTVFLTGEWVYKLKKSVDFGFLNFTGLSDRRHFCHEEVRLNQRLSEGIYQGVEEIRRDADGRLSLNGPGEVVEYAVKMRQLPEADNLQALLREGVERRQLRRLGAHLASFYERSARGGEIDHYGEAEVIAYNMEENFRQIDPFVGEWVPAEKWEFIRQVSRAFFKNWRQLFDHRLKTGRVRDGHGDLRTDHIYFYEGIQIIDCIEFNDRFRYGDVINDLAFLHMDLEHLGHAAASRAILAAYVEHADDPELYTLIDFYAAYRAIVKLKVACLQSTAADAGERERLHAQAADYLLHAYRYALQFSRPTLWVFCGLPASGKSTLAKQVAQDLSAVLLQSDRIRKQGEGCPPLCPGVTDYGEGLYRPELRQRVYAQMLAKAQEELHHGRSVVLDASFSRRKWRAEARQLARDLDTNILFAECACREETMRKRLKLRDERAELSDARLPHLHHMIRDFEPITELPAANHLQLDTDQPFPTLLDHALAAGYARKCEQIEGLLQQLI